MPPAAPSRAKPTPTPRPTSSCGSPSVRSRWGCRGDCEALHKPPHRAGHPNGMQRRLAHIMLAADLLLAVASVINGAPSTRAWAWAFNLDAPLGLGLWLPVFHMARQLLQELHPPV